MTFFFFYFFIPFSHFIFCCFLISTKLFSFFFFAISSDAHTTSSLFAARNFRFSAFFLPKMKWAFEKCISMIKCVYVNSDANQKNRNVGVKLNLTSNFSFGAVKVYFCPQHKFVSMPRSQSERKNINETLDSKWITPCIVA